LCHEPRNSARPGKRGRRWEIFGGFLAPIAAGALAAAHGLGVPLWIAAASALVVFLVALVLEPAAKARSTGLVAIGRDDAFR